MAEEADQVIDIFVSAGRPEHLDDNEQSKTSASNESSARLVLKPFPFRRDVALDRVSALVLIRTTRKFREIIRAGELKGSARNRALSITG